MPTYDYGHLLVVNAQSFTGLSGQPTSSAYRTEALLHRFTHLFDRTGAETTEDATAVAPIHQAVAAIRHTHDHPTRHRLGVCLANQW